MAKKRTKRNAVSNERVGVIVLKGSRQYRDWLASLSRETLIPVASIVRDALKAWAQAKGLPEPPER